MKWFWRVLGALAAVLVVAFLVLRTPDTDATEMRAKYGGAPSQFVTLENDMTVHLRDEGPRDAPAIVLLHGSNADLHTWQAWVDGLREDYRVIRFDQRGHGLTGPGARDSYALEDFVADLDLVADELGLERFVLGGNSMGGWIAAGYAMEHPGRIDGLVLVDAAGAPVEREGGGNLAFTIARMPVIGAAMSQLLPRSLVERSLSQSVSNQAVVTPEAVDRYWELARYPGNRAATRARFSNTRMAFDAKAVAALEIPTLIIWGEEDALIPVAAARWYDERLPQSTLAIYPGIGHLPMEETPKRSLADLRTWLKTVYPSPAPK
ncbi:MAG: alpha/beta hydrolase [Sphingomonadaceae bacterium]